MRERNICRRGSSLVGRAKRLGVAGHGGGDAVEDVVEDVVGVGGGMALQLLAALDDDVVELNAVELDVRVGRVDRSAVGGKQVERGAR